jgi:hypothetical protein
MQIVVKLYCSGNNDKKIEIVCVQAQFFPNIFNYKLIESTDMEPVDTEDQLCTVFICQFKKRNKRKKHRKQLALTFVLKPLIFSIYV